MFYEIVLFRKTKWHQLAAKFTGVSKFYHLHPTIFAFSLRLCQSLFSEEKITKMSRTIFVLIFETFLVFSINCDSVVLTLTAFSCSNEFNSLLVTCVAKENRVHCGYLGVNPYWSIRGRHPRGQLQCFQSLLDVIIMMKSTRDYQRIILNLYMWCSIVNVFD